MPRKRICLIALVIMGILILSPSVLASGIGYVDLDFLFMAHPEYESRNQEYQEILEQCILEYQEHMENITDEAELNKLADYYDAEITRADKEISGFIIESIIGFIETVAEENNISIVLTKEIIIFGGTDLTELVLEEMYDYYGISVPSYLRLKLAANS